MTSSEAVDASATEDGGAISRQQWQWSTLAGMASYLDAGSIVALGAGLAVFQSHLGLSDGAVGALAAIGPNAIGCAIGAFIGGRLGDKLGRKRIYKYDLWSTPSASSASPWRSTRRCCSSARSWSASR